MRYKGILTGLTQGNKGFFNTFSFPVRSYAHALQNPPLLDITQPFVDDYGNNRQAFPNDPARSTENNDAFLNALISTRFTDITIPAGRYYFSQPITNIVNGSPVIFPKKTIRGSAIPKTLSFPNVGYNLTLDGPSTILDFTLLGANTDTLITIRGYYEQPINATGPVSRGVGSLSGINNAGIIPGDIFVFTNPNLASYGPRPYYRNGEFFTVTSIPSGSTNRVNISPVLGCYPDLTNPGRVVCPESTQLSRPPKLYLFAKLKPLQINMENLTIVDDRIKSVSYWSSNGNPYLKGAPVGLNLTQCTKSTLTNVFIIDASYHSAFVLNNCLDVRINGGNYVLGIPHVSRSTNDSRSPIKVTDGYNGYLPTDGYGIAISDSQKIDVDSVQASSWRHAITTGSGGGNGNGESDIFWIVNRNIKVKNSTFNATPATIAFYDSQGNIQPESSNQPAYFKTAPANFHGNIENSSYEGNTLNGSGFNIGGHNITLDNNTVFVNNRNEPMKVYSRHEDAAFYFDESKSGQFKITNNKVYINKFYQNDLTEKYQTDNGEEFRYGEFVNFSLGGIFGRGDGTNPSKPNPSCVERYSYWLSGMIYSGTLEITDNCVRIMCAGENQTKDYTTGIITIGGVPIDRCLDNYISGNQDAQNALRSRVIFDVKISENVFSIFNNPTKSNALVAINTKRSDISPQIPYWSRVRKLEIVGNKFCGHFRFRINQGRLFDNAKSDIIQVKNNTFWTDLTNAEANIDHNNDRTKSTRIDILNNTNQTLVYIGSCPEVGLCSGKK